MSEIKNIYDLVNLYYGKLILLSLRIQEMFFNKEIDISCIFDIYKLAVVVLGLENFQSRYFHYKYSRKK